MIKNLPQGWKVEKLGQITTIQAGGTPSRTKQEYWNGDIPWIKISDIKNKYTIKSTEFISEAGLKNSSAKLLQPNTILYTIFATLGEVSILRLKATTNQAIVGIVINDKILINEYLYFYLKSIKEKIMNEGRGVAQNNINLSILKDISIPLPPLPQQEKIVKVLDNSSSLVEQQKQLIEKYDVFLKSKFIEMFGDPITNPMGWKIEKLENFTELVSSGSTPKGGQSVYLEEGEIKFIRSQNVRMNKMDYDGIYYISEEIFNSMKRTQVKYNDVLLNITGASIGRTAIYKECSRANVNQHVCIIRLNNTLNNLYLNYLIATDSFQNQIISNQSGATREALNFSQIKQFKISCPPIELQNKFASIVEKIEAIKEKETQKLNHLETLHVSLMDKTFKGEIV